MSIWESEPTFAVICDEPGCYESSPEEAGERHAKRTALDEGWVEIDGKWYCPDHAGRAQRRAKKAAARRAGK